MAKIAYIGTGRRKKSVARVRLLPGTGNITINKRDIEEYFGLETLKMIVRAPLVLTNLSEKIRRERQRLRRRHDRPGGRDPSRHLPRAAHR